MIELLNRYIYIFLHPFKIHQDFKTSREKIQMNVVNVLPFPTELTGVPRAAEQEESIQYSRAEGIAISWIFAIIVGMYEVFATNLSLISYDYLSQDSSLSRLLLDTYSQSTHGFFIFLTMMNVVFFPVAAWLYLKFWEVMIRFFAQVFEAEEDHEVVIDQILSCSLSSHLLLVIPVFGTMAHYTANLLYLFAGLKNNMGLTILQSVIVLVSPLFLMLLFVFLVFFFFFALFGML